MISASSSIKQSSEGTSSLFNGYPTTIKSLVMKHLTQQPKLLYDLVQIAISLTRLDGNGLVSTLAKGIKRLWDNSAHHYARLFSLDLRLRCSAKHSGTEPRIWDEGLSSPISRTRRNVRTQKCTWMRSTRWRRNTTSKQVAELGIEVRGLRVGCLRLFWFCLLCRIPLLLCI